MHRADIDPIAPTQIEHCVDEVWIDDQLEQRYNFLDYLSSSRVHIFERVRTSTSRMS